MARIDTYIDDADIRLNDKVIGTDGGDGTAGSGGFTRNFEFEDLRNFVITGSATDVLPDGVIPLSSSGHFAASGMTQTGSDIVINSNVTFRGEILGSNGMPIVDNTNSGADASTQLVYGTEHLLLDIAGGASDAEAFNVYVFTGELANDNYVLTLPASPREGSWIKVSNLVDEMGTGVVRLSANGNTFQNDANAPNLDLDMSSNRASFELVWIEEINTWVVIGAQ